MNIAYLSTFYPYRGGIAQFNANLFRAFEKKNTINAYTFTRQYPEVLFPGKTQLVTPNDLADAIPSKSIVDSINPISWITAANSIKKEKPDLLVMKYWMTFFGPSLGTVANRLKKETTIITILDNVIPHERRFFDHAFNRFFLSQNHAFVAMSEKVKNDLLYYLPNAKVVLKSHPLYDHFGKKLSKNEARKHLNIPTDKKILLFFGIIRDYKGLDILLETMRHLPKDYHLIVAGESYGDFGKYDSIIKKNNIENISLFNRYINDDEVPLFFSAADVNVLPYRSATQSGITSIAYHFNLPQIATPVGGLPEIIFHEKTGLLTKNVSAEALQLSIKQYFNENKKQTFIDGIERLKKELGWDNFAQAIIDLKNNCSL
jgi:glycosyltransferase involved in cell wall biosynthesis